jgi:hypothetical protein
MKVEKISLGPGKTAGRTRLSATVSYDDTASQEEYWYEVGEDAAGSLSESGNAWVAALLPLAVTLGEPLRLGTAPVDAALLENAARLMTIWKSWYPSLSIVPIEADVRDSATPASTPTKTVSFLSGGIDSYCTALVHREKAPIIDEFMIVHGFNIPLADREAFAGMRAVLEKAAAHLGHPLVSVETNIKQTRLRVARWGQLFYGPALASVGLALEKRYANVIISASLNDAHLMPWGSHPLTDPLCSTSRTRILHDGTQFTRVEKTERVAQDRGLLNLVHVCAVSFSDRDCGACHKCYLTMITLELFGLLEQCGSFPERRIDLRRIERIYLDEPMKVVLFEEVKTLALQKGRADIAEAIDRSFKRSARLRKQLRYSEWLRQQPFIWRGAEPLEKLLLGDSLR